MPRYFFNLSNGPVSVQDLVGRDLPDDEVAKAEAKRLAAEFGIDQALEGRPPAYQWLEVVDEHSAPWSGYPWQPR